MRFAQRSSLYCMVSKQTLPLLVAPNQHRQSCHRPAALVTSQGAAVRAHTGGGLSNRERGEVQLTQCAESPAMQKQPQISVDSGAEFCLSKWPFAILPNSPNL